MKKVAVSLIILFVASFSACDTFFPPIKPKPKAPTGHFSAEPVTFYPLLDGDESGTPIGIDTNGESATLEITFDDGQVFKAKIVLSIESALVEVEGVDDEGNLILVGTQSGTFEILNELGSTAFEGNWTSEEQLKHGITDFNAIDIEIAVNLSGVGKDVYSGHTLSGSAQISANQDEDPQISLEGNVKKG